MIKDKRAFTEMISKKTTATAVVLLASALAFPVYAAGTGGRREALKSEGIIEYTDGENKVLIDSRDLYYLADEIDNLETAAKWETLQAIQTLPDAASSAGLAGKTAADISNITFADLNGAIRSSQQSSSAPVAAEILSGKIAWANGRKITGSMRNNGATGASNLNAGSSYSIPAGYTTGGTVTTASLASQTAATATAAEILSGKTAWVNGQKISGSMKNNGTTGAANLNAGNSYSIPAGYTTGGTVTTASLASQTAATAIAANISAGKTAWVNGQLITGTGEDNNSFYEQGYAAGSNDNVGLTGNSKEVPSPNIEVGANYKLVFEFDTGITGRVLGKSIIISPWSGQTDHNTGGGSVVVRNIEYDPNTGRGTMETFGVWSDSVRVYY